MAGKGEAVTVTVISLAWAGLEGGTLSVSKAQTFNRWRQGLGTHSEGKSKCTHSPAGWAPLSKAMGSSCPLGEP